jgi:hypothetical protein
MLGLRCAGGYEMNDLRSFHAQVSTFISKSKTTCCLIIRGLKRFKNVKSVDHPPLSDLQVSTQEMSVLVPCNSRLKLAIMRFI